MVNDEYILSAIDNYYLVLSYVGNCSYKEVFKLLIMSYINDIYKLLWFLYLEPEQQDMLYKLILCIKGSHCIFPSNCSDISVTLSTT